MNTGKIISDGDFSSVLTSSSITGTDVINGQDESLGTIKDVMIDLESGSIAYAIVSFGGFLGIGDKYFAVPWDAFTIDQRQEKFILNVDKDTLKNAPGFDKDNWPKTADQQFISQMHAHYGTRPYWERYMENDPATRTTSGTTVDTYTTGRPATGL